MFLVFFFKQKTAYDMRISDWSSDVCSSDLLDRVSLHVEPKEFVIVVGQSGAGKSTLLKLLTREERQTSGKIIIGGIDYDKLKDKNIPNLRRKIGVVFQDFKLLPIRTVFENVAFALEIVGMTSNEIKHTKIGRAHV